MAPPNPDQRPNTQPTPQARSFNRNGRMLHRLCKVFARLDLPATFDPPADRPILFAGNHRSFFDIAIAYAVFAELGFSSNILVRADLFDRPLVGGWLRRTGCIPMSSKVKEQAEASALASLHAGHTVSIMPEGRLVPADERPSGVGPARPGVSRIAVGAGAAVVPVAFHGTDHVWPRGVPMPIPRFKRPPVVLRLGDPIVFDDDNHVENANVVMETIRSMLADIDAGRHLP